MVTFLSFDLTLNSILDYDLFNDGTDSNLLLGLLGVQVVIQITIFLILFIAMADTFLFRVGLLGLLMKKFRLVLLMQPIYIMITLLAGAFRVRRLQYGDTFLKLWRNQTFIQLSSAQKVIAIPYYLLNLRATIKLGDPVYYDKDTWVNLIRQFKDNDDHIYTQNKTVQ